MSDILKKALTILEVVGAALLAIAGYFWLSDKKDSANVTKEINTVNNELAVDNKQIANNDTTLAQQEKVRNQLKEDMEKNNNAEETSDNVIDFFNTRK